MDLRSWVSMLASSFTDSLRFSVSGLCTKSRALSALFAAVYFTMTAMKNSKLRTGAAVTIKRLFLLTSLIFIPATLLMAQSVADAAKTERERRERVKGQGKVFTDSDLKSITERSNVPTGTLGKGINTPPDWQTFMA